MVAVALWGVVVKTLRLDQEIGGYNAGMFIRPCYRKKNGKRHAYWALMESYRTERGPRQRIVAYLGQLDESHRLGVKNAAEGNPEARQKQLFGDTRPHWVEVDVKRMQWKTAATSAGLGWDCSLSSSWV